MHPGAFAMWPARHRDRDQTSVALRRRIRRRLDGSKGTNLLGILGMELNVRGTGLRRLLLRNLRLQRRRLAMMTGGCTGGDRFQW